MLHHLINIHKLSFSDHWYTSELRNMYRLICDSLTAPQITSTQSYCTFCQAAVVFANADIRLKTVQTPSAGINGVNEREKEDR